MNESIWTKTSLLTCNPRTPLISLMKKHLVNIKTLFFTFRILLSKEEVSAILGLRGTAVLQSNTG